MSAVDRTREVRELVFALARQLEAEVKETVNSLDLTTPQANALRDLNRPMTMRELADVMVCDPSSVTYVVDRLEDRGLVERRPHPTDRRAKVLHLTDDGARARAALIQRFEYESPLAALTDTDLTALRAMLARVVEGARGNRVSA